MGRSKMGETLFLEVADFEVQQKDGNGSLRYFDGISRIQCHSKISNMDMELDINTDLYPLVIGDQLKMVLTSSLCPREHPDVGIYDADFLELQKSKVDKYDYAMHGKIYKVRDAKTAKGTRIEVYISYGGLLMQLTGDPAILEKLELDDSVYLLLKKLTP